MTDADLIERARGGDAAAFGDLVDRHRGAVLRAALAATGRHADAEDVAQEAFVKCHRSLATFRAESSFRTWVVAIAWRTAVSRRRSLRHWWSAGSRWGTGEQVDAAAEGVPATGRSPEQLVLDGEYERRVRQLVRSLPARLRDPLLLATSGEYSMREIAQMLGEPEGTVKWRIAEARRLLKAKLERLGLGAVERRG